MSAKEIIANTAVEGRHDPIGMLHAEAIVRMLTFMGYRIVGPDEVDPVTVERTLDAAGDYMDSQYGNTALLHPTDRVRIIRTFESGGK